MNIEEIAKRREFYKPTNAVILNREDVKVLAYMHDTKDKEGEIRYYLTLFRGRAWKPSVHVWCNSPEKRQELIEKAISWQQQRGMSFDVQTDSTHYKSKGKFPEWEVPKIAGITPEKLKSLREKVLAVRKQQEK